MMPTILKKHQLVLVPGISLIILLSGCTMNLKYIPKPSVKNKNVTMPKRIGVALFNDKTNHIYNNEELIFAAPISTFSNSVAKALEHKNVFLSVNYLATSVADNSDFQKIAEVYGIDAVLTGNISHINIYDGPTVGTFTIYLPLFFLSFLGPPTARGWASLDVSVNCKLISCHNGKVIWISGEKVFNGTEYMWVSPYTETEVEEEKLSELLTRCCDELACLLDSDIKKRKDKYNDLFVQKSITTIQKTPKPPPPSSQETPHIAIWRLTPSKGVSPDMMGPLTEALRSHVLDSGHYKLIARGEMEKIMKEQDISLSSTCDTTDCAVEYGKMLSVDKFVVGSVSKIGRTWLVVLKLININTGEIEKGGRASGKGEEDTLIDLIGKAAKDLTD